MDKEIKKAMDKKAGELAKVYGVSSKAGTRIVEGLGILFPSATESDRMDSAIKAICK